MSTGCLHCDYWIERRKGRLQRALQRAIYITIVKRGGKIPAHDEVGVAALNRTINRIFDRAEKLGLVGRM